LSDAFRTAASVFLDSYVKDFERRDAPAIAEHFRFPLQVTGDAGEVTSVSIPSRDAWMPLLERLLIAYARLDVRTARRLELYTNALSPRLGQATTRWALEDSAGDLVYQFDATYTLAETDGSLKIAAIAHNEQLRMREALAKKQAAG
jgi:hypothetical protein